MSYYQLKNPTTGEVKSLRRMDRVSAHFLNKERDDDFKWQPGLDNMESSLPPGGKSITPLLRLLDTEGFSEHHVNIIDRWMRKRKTSRRERSRALENLTKRFAEFMREQPRSVRKMVGRFMGAHHAQVFEAGLSIGLSGRAIKEGEEYDE